MRNYSVKPTYGRITTQRRAGVVRRGVRAVLRLIREETALRVERRVAAAHGRIARRGRRPIRRVVVDPRMRAHARGVLPVRVAPVVSPVVLSARRRHRGRARRRERAVRRRRRARRGRPRRQLQRRAILREARRCGRRPRRLGGRRRARRGVVHGVRGGARRPGRAGRRCGGGKQRAGLLPVPRRRRRRLGRRRRPGRRPSRRRRP